MIVQVYLGWTDISPGFRFARVLHAYKELNIAPGDWPEEDLNGFVLELQQRVCKMYGWPTPTELAAQWLVHLESKSCSWFLDPVFGGFRYSTTMQLLKLRRDRPGDVVVNNIDYASASVGRTAGWITTEFDSELTPTCLATPSEQQATEFYFHLFALSPALLGSKPERLGHLRRYPRHVREQCVADFDTWGKATADWPSEAFVRNASQLLGIDS
ncbi:MAG: hypothetical protein JNK25_03410 [Phycisphaerae bacterium]|nr:hypothetical protein [Phycisphaerae bacterium]